MRTLAAINAVAIALGPLGFAPAACAQEPRIALSWSIPEGAQCPDLGYVAHSLESMLGPTHPGRREVQAKVTVRRRGPNDWELRLETEQAGVRGQRELQDASCQALADATVVILAWMIDPEKMAAAATTPSQPTSPEKSPSNPPQVATATPKAAASRPLSSLVSAELGLDVGTMPRPSAGALGRFELEAYPVRWGLRGAYFPSVSHTLERSAGGDEPGGRFTLWNVGVQFCLQHRGWLTARVELGACAGPELDVMRGAAFGVTSPSSGSKAWLAGLLELGFRYELSPYWSMGVHAAGVLPSLRESFAVQNLGVIHRPAAAALRASAGLELRL